MNCRWRVGMSFVGLGAGLMISCAGRSAVVTPSVTMQVEAPDTNLGVHAVVPEEKLHSGDKVAVKITADRLAHVYLVRVATQQPEILADKMVQPGQSLRVPDGGQWWELGSDTGHESIVVVASLQPLPPDVVLARAHGPATDERCEPPKCSNDGNRGGNQLFSRWDKKGTAVLQFPFIHE